MLTSPYGLQLYVMPRPDRSVEFVVLPMLPAGCEHKHAFGLKSPQGIAVAADPARAAAAVRRRILQDYRFDALPVLRAASPGHLLVQVTRDAERRPRIRTTYVYALIELLARGGFLLDPATGECHLAATLTEQQANRQLVKSAQRLRQRGFRVTTTSSVSPGAGSPVRRSDQPKRPSR
ncbi:hypothetical protein [Streptomyces sp. NPDC001508]|uniref:hypothetical protein n=1 Tax=Streptomyces sp. NPDC001508 TaxID=3154656 RepID=UPI003325629E